MLDGEGAYTAVEGEKSIMSPGDFVITANWAPHDHGNNSKKPMMWLDVLDFPMVNLFETSFAEHFHDKTQTTAREDGDSLAFYGSGVLPDGVAVEMKQRTPVINYTYARTRPILERLKKAGDIDKRHGARVRYANPITGGWVLPTMGAYLALLPKGFKGEPYRSTDGTVFVVRRRARAPPRSATRCWSGARTTCSWCRRGCPMRTRRSRNRCCSRSPTARRRKPWGSGARRRDSVTCPGMQRGTLVRRCRSGTPLHFQVKTGSHRGAPQGAAPQCGTRGKLMPASFIHDVSLSGSSSPRARSRASATKRRVLVSPAPW